MGESTKDSRESSVTLPPAKVRALIGVYRNDWEDERFRDVIVPVIAGVVDATVWEHETDVETEARWATCKAAFDPDGVAYEWREVWLTVEAAGLRAPFETADVPARVDPEANGA